MAFDFNNTPFKKKDSDPLNYSPPYTPGAGNSLPQDPIGTAPSNPFGSNMPTGFQNVPEKKTNFNPLQRPNYYEAPDVYAPPRPRPVRAPINIPWRLVITLVLVVGVLAFLYVNRFAITSFLTEMISWVVVIAVFAVIIKLLLFPGGRDRRR